MRKLVIAALVGALSVGALAAAGCGPHVHGSAGVAVGPPVPPEAGIYYDDRSGYVWVEGRWVWNGYEYVWQPGYWLEARPGFVYIQGYWDLRHGHYYWVPGSWSRHRAGHVWVRGHWGYVDGRRRWVRGRWQPQRKGQQWRPGYWERSGSKRVWRPGNWQRSQPRVRDHRRSRPPERVPSRRGRRR